MDPYDWTYVAEGGQHVIFAHHSSHENNKWSGRVLRIHKRDMVLSARAVDCEESRQEPQNSSRDGYNEVWIHKVLAPELSPYLDIPKTLYLSVDFVSKLRQATLDSGKIPYSRRGTWGEPGSMEGVQENHVGETRCNPCVVKATLHVNYRQTVHSIPKRCKNNHGWLSVEIKPKAGYTAISPLVHSRSRVKYQYTRFHMLQQLHSKGCITKGWCGNNENKGNDLKTSRYCPLDLYSNSESRIQKALDELWNCPQNNLKICHQSTNMEIRLVDETTATPAFNEKTFCHVLREAFGRQATCETDAKDVFHHVLKQVMTSILCSESRLLPKLLDFQTLDLIDGDGAVLIYNRLVELCEGSQTEAEQLLENSSSIFKEEKESARKNDHELLEASPLRVPIPCETLYQYCELVQSFSQKVRQHDTIVEENSLWLDQARREALSLVERFSQDECVYLLRNWLLSLTMCDVSFFVTLRPLQEYESSEIDKMLENEPERDTCRYVCRVVSPQNTNSAGRLVCETNIGKNKSCKNILWMEYSVKLVDFDMKPADKLRKRAAAESAMQQHLADLVV